MNRRDFMKVVGLGAAVAPMGMASLSAAAGASSPGKPNIVIIMTDQQRADVCKREGFPLDTTPFLDNLALGFDYIIVDLGDSVDEMQLEILDRAMRCMVVVTPEIVSVHQAKRLLTRLQALHFSHNNIRLVINKFEEALPISNSIIELNLKLSASVIIPRADKEVSGGFLNGSPEVASSPSRSVISRLFANISTARS